jgi:hypothetical protein
VVIGTRPDARESPVVQVIASPRAIRMPIGAAIVGGVVGLFLLTGGLFLAWLAFATPLVSTLTPSPVRPTLPQMAMGGAIWGLAMIAPAAFALVGAWRLSRVFRALIVKPRPRLLTGIGRQLDDEYLAASDVRLPEGRIIHDLVLGPFGVAVLNEMPPARFLRHTGSSWEARHRSGRWLPYENPMERATRDAERVKRWFAATERDYVLRVYSAVVTEDPTVARTPTCAVVTAEQVPAWLASLPPSRSITADRKSEIVEQLSQLL